MVVGKVITMGRIGVTGAVIRGTGTDSTPITGDFRELTFFCNFSANAVNSGAGLAPNPAIRVMIRTFASAGSFQVEIVPPRGNPETLSSIRRPRGPVSWARPTVVVAGRPQVLPTSPVRREIGVTRWELDDPFGDIYDPIDPVDPSPPGGGGGTGPMTYTRELDPARDERGVWTVRVSNRGLNDEQFSITVDHPETVQDLYETRVPFQLINRAFAQAMLALQLRMRIDNGEVRIRFSKWFHELTGLQDPITAPVSDIFKDINLVDFTITLGNENGFPTITAGLDLEDRGEEIGVGPLGADAENLAITCRIPFWFQYSGRPFWETAMRRQNNRVERQFMSLSASIDFNPDISGLWADFLDKILRFSLANTSIDELVQEFVTAAEEKLRMKLAESNVATYFQDVIMHLVQRDNVMFRLTADDEGLVVLHHPRPSPRDFLEGDVTPEDDGVVVAETRATGVPVGGRDIPSTRPNEERITTAPPFSARIAARRGRRLREGDIDHIVVLMMENRSFDHMLGYRSFINSDTNGLTGNETNSFSRGGSYRVFHLAKTAGIRTPAHGFDATREQIANGTMNGFVENYSKRAGVFDPGLVMSYYDARELPMYEFLANNFAICDAWHSAHPGETQCNRFAALTGKTPELRNFELSDRRLAYYTGFTILDYLTDADIDWVYAEGNVGFLRMFDRYRIDISRVIPFEDFLERVAGGNLPKVSFIDPRFIDIPPAWDANDDLPPADVLCGQELVSQLYTVLSTARTWPKTLLLVTYDEHGGFYDHATPLGIPTSLDPNPNPFPRLHPNGPEHLGVRVPAFVVSPWVDGGTVFHTPYDHTSIVKTILQRFAPGDFPIAEEFGPRAAAANGLFSESLRTSARPQPAPAAPEIQCERRYRRGPSGDADRREFELSMRLLGVPAKYRGRTAWRDT